MPFRQQSKHWQPPRKAASRVVTPEETPDAPFGPVFTEIPRSEISSTKSDGEHPKITETQTVACFNWLEEREPHIIVPGMPPKWTPLDRPRPLKQDAGIYYRDRNAAHYPDNPIEPTVEAIMKMNPSVNDAMTRHFPTFAAMAIPFLKATLHGMLVHAVRPHISALFNSGFGGLGCLVRFEGDGYLPDKAGQRVEKEALSRRIQEPHTPEDLAALLSISGTAAHSSKSPLKMSEAGCLVPQGAVFDLKTRSIKRKDDEDAIVADELPRLWVRQVSTLILAYHTCGTFRDIQIRDVRAEMAEWEETNREVLVCFSKLLRRILDISTYLEDGRMEITCKEGDDGLCFRKQTAEVKPAFSQATENRWKAWLSHDATDGHEKPSSEEETDGRGLDDDTPNYTACDEECDYCGHCK
ncbi:hypothetical protein BBAD15_g5597 [Beauveria bassiana D1-5]|uniref:Geranylgeranyl pyrophosphate synthetase n=1 Tax=Beauveria bassiana D1-5 TaxID=1245745 RepID=A0A0A2VSC1_BEABA|nr:hypothetical protein BBAD15_g5597 [Beauveria bassiana D1-5]